MFKKEFWKYFFNSYKNAKWLLLRYIIIAIYSTVSMVLANTLQITYLTYFNAVLTLSAISEIIAFGISNSVGVYINQNISNDRKVNHYIKVGFQLNLIFAFIITIIFVAGKDLILKYMFGINESVNDVFYYIMMTYNFFQCILCYFLFVVKFYKSFTHMLFQSIITLLIIIGGLSILFATNQFVLLLIGFVYLISSILSIIYIAIFFNKIIGLKINFFKYEKFNLTKKEICLFSYTTLSEIGWQIGITFLSFFLAKVDNIIFNQYAYYEYTLDIFNGLFFTFATMINIDIIRNLGNKKYDNAYKIGVYSIYGSIVIWLIYVILSFIFFYPLRAGMNIELQSTAAISLVLYVLYYLIKFFEWMLCGYVLYCGGKIKTLAITQVFETLAFFALYLIADFILNNIYLVYTLIALPCLICTIIYFVLFFKKKWLKNINLDDEGKGFMNNVTTIFFDFDNTLYSGYDWKNWKEYCLKSLKIVANLSEQEVEDLQKEYANKILDHKAIYNILEKHKIRYSEWRKYEEEHPFQFDFADNSIKHISNKELLKFSQKYHIFITSNSEPFLVEDMCKKLNINAALFDGICCNKFEKNKSSKYYIYKEIMEKYNISPENIIVIGDNYDTDIKPILKLGGYGINVNSANFTLNEIENITDIKDAIKN